MPSKVFSAALSGLNVQIIEVEVDVSYDLPVFLSYGQHPNNYLKFELEVKV